MFLRNVRTLRFEDKSKIYTNLVNTNSHYTEVRVHGGE